MARTTNDRMVLVLAGCLLLLAVLELRLVWLQALGARQSRAIAQRQQQHLEPLLGKRGRILDCRERILAMSVQAPSVFADPRHVAGGAETAHRLADVTGADPALVRARLGQEDRGFVWIARQIAPQARAELASLRRAGVGVRDELKRVYPHGTLGGHLMGFVDIDHQGLEGLELAFNGALRGYDGWRRTLRDGQGQYLVGPWTTEALPTAGHDLVLTIDAVVQQVAEETLDWGVETFNAKGGSVIVMDPATGAVLAMATWPNYDPNDPGRARPETRRNRTVTDLFEPGSIFKIVAASALLEEGRISPEETIFCEHGEYPTVARHVLHDHHGYGTLSFADVIRLSSNIGVAKAAQRLTPEELYRYIRAFGFGEPTGIDVPGEISGILRPPGRWSRLSPFILPIGQEIAVTPIQLAVMTSVIANGGWRVTPRVVERIQDADGAVVRVPASAPPVRVLSAETARVMQELLVSVVGSGTGRLANVQGLTAAGKTGTAQKIEPNGRYSHSRFVASFVGFAPVPDPSVVIVVNMDEPRPVYYGGSVAAPMFRRVVERLMGYWELERTAEPAMVRRAPSRPAESAPRRLAQLGRAGEDE
ncbi:MAG TPA: penicillin-binding protein 2 [bacterium]